MTFEDAAAAMKREYDSDSRQLQVQSSLEGLKLGAFMSSHSISTESEGLNKIVEHIERLTPQCPPGFRSDENKIRYLRSAVLGYEWTLTSIRSIVTHGYKFHGFVTALHESLQLSEELKTRTSSPFQTHALDMEEEDAAETFFQRYGRHPRDVRKHNPRNRTSRNHRGSAQARNGGNSRSFEEARRRNECFKCGAGWKPGHRCAADAITENARNRLRQGESHIRIVRDLLLGLESESLGAAEADHPAMEGQFPLGGDAEKLCGRRACCGRSSAPDILRRCRGCGACTQHAVFSHGRAFDLCGFSVGRCDPKPPSHSPKVWPSPHAHTRPDRKPPWSNLDCSSIFAANLRNEYSSNRPLGFCVDIGAPKSVAGRKEMNRILAAIGARHRTVQPSNNRFRFGDETFESLGIVSLPLVTPKVIDPILVEFDIVQADVPSLLGMDILDREMLVADTVFNRIASRTAYLSNDNRIAYVDEWSIPLIRSSSEHVYAPINRDIRTNFTRSQLHKLHRQFFHPSAEKLFNLITRARPEHATPETRKILKDLTNRCDPCQRIQPAPVRFRVSFGTGNVLFNERIIMDIMYIESAPILHIIDEATHFSAARLLPSISTFSVWDALLRCWATIYTGLPNRILVDQGSQFGKSEPFISLAARSNVNFEATGIEAHASLGIGERYHQPLRSTFRKLRIDYPSADKELLLQLAVKAMNGTLGPEGLVPSSLVFGEYPKVYTRSETPQVRSTIDERATMLQSARAEMQRHMAKVRVSRALKHAVPPAADRSYQPGDKVPDWREKIVNNRIGEWLGPFTVLGVNSEKKILYVQDVEIGNARPFNVTQVKRYIPPKEIAYSLFSAISRGIDFFKSDEDAENGAYRNR